MTTMESGQAAVTGVDEFCSKEWCVQAVAMWDEVVFPNFVDPDNYNHSCEYKDTDTGAICQWKTERGRIVHWEPGKLLSDDELTFILWATHDNWKKVADGKLDPVGAIASKLIHMRKGPMAVVIKEAAAAKELLRGPRPSSHGLVSAVQTEDATFAVELDERGGEANGAAYLVHMLLTQQAEADHTGRFAREARRLKPVKLSLRDTGEACSVSAVPSGLSVTSEGGGRHATSVQAESRHVIDVTQLRLAGRALITGPLRDEKFQGLVRDIARRKVVIRGLVFHYANTMRFLWLVNVNRPSA